MSRQTTRRIVAVAAAAAVLIALVACNGSTEQQEQTTRMTVREYAQWCADIDPVKIGDAKRYGDLTTAAQTRYLAYRDLLFSGRLPIALRHYHLYFQEGAETLYDLSFRQNQSEPVDSRRFNRALLDLRETESIKLDDALGSVSPENLAILEEEDCDVARR